MHKTAKHLVLRLWQPVFLLLSSSWLMAPALNRLVSGRTTLISQYETAGQPYAWLFRLCDALAALMVISMSYWLYRQDSSNKHRKVFLWLVLAGCLALLDPIATTQCRLLGSECVEYAGGVSFYIHAIESVLLAVVLFGVCVYDIVRRKTTASYVFFCFQIMYLMLFATSLADRYHFGTLSQFMYQLAVNVWLAWLVVDIGGLRMKPQNRITGRVVRHALAAWTYVNGIIAVVVSVWHIHILRGMRELYFAPSTAWLAQHGVILGLVMLYLSRHIWRGEYRARLILLFLLATNILKYAVFTPSVPLVLLYASTFSGLLFLRPFFNRGAAQLSWQARLQDIGLLVAGFATAVITVTWLFIANPHHFEVARKSYRHFHRLALGGQHVPHAFLQSTLLAHTATVAAGTLILLVLWSLFRPAQHHGKLITTEESQQAQDLLQSYSTSSEDYFKIFPGDKQYFWLKNSDGIDGFIAYKISGSVVFGLADAIAITPAKRHQITQLFIQEWVAKGYRVCFLLVPDVSKEQYKKLGLNVLQIGSNAAIDVQQFNTTVRNKWWRWQINKATKQGYQFRTSLGPHTSQMLSQLRQVSDAWLERPGHREQGFAMGSFDEDYLNSCQVNYLVDGAGQVVAFTNIVPTFNNQTQTTIDMMRFRPDRENTMPMLLAETIKLLATQTDITHFDLGFVPLARMDSRIAKAIKAVAGFRFASSGLEQFKNKFEPTWHKCFIAYDGDVADLAVITLRLEKAMEATID